MDATILLILLLWIATSGGMEAAARSPTARAQDAPVPPAKKRAGKQNASTSLLAAVQAGDIAAVRTHLAKGANPKGSNGEGSTALFHAIEKERVDIITLLIDKGAADVNAVGRGKQWEGMPPLIWAALGRNARIVSALLQAGASVKAVDPAMKATALDFACSGGQVAMARMLLAKGAEVDSRSWLGGTPLMGAAMARSPELVKLLIARGANVNARDDNTRRMYGQAQFMGDTKVMNEIRQSGKLEVRREDGNSVLDWARIGQINGADNHQVIELLKKAGATR
jgi:ankyrin repeat protein